MRTGGLQALLRAFPILTACFLTWSAANSDARAAGKFPADVPVVVAQCPELKRYDAEQTAKAANELRDLLKRDPKAVTPSMMRDYRAHRDQCRAYEGN